MWVRGHGRSLKVVPLESFGAVSYSPSIVTMVVSVAVCEIFSVKEWCDLGTGLGFVQGHWKWHHLIERTRVPIRLPWQLWRYFVSFARYGDLLVENREIFIPHLYLAPSQGVTPSQFREYV